MTTQAIFQPKMAWTEKVGLGGVRENRLVAGANDDTVVEAGATSLRVVGVSKYTQAANTETTVENKKELEVVYAAAANKGDRLISAANGEVTPVPVVAATVAAADVTNTRAIVGYCTKTIAAPGVGRAYIDVV